MVFSMQDSRYEPAPTTLDSYGAAEMMADLGIHRRAALPLAGSSVVLPPPPPDITKVTKRDPKAAKLAAEYPEIPNAWAALFDPKLVEERDDGLGTGQMHRSGPNYQPDGPEDHHRGPRGPDRKSRYPETGSLSGRGSRHERSPPSRALRHAKSLFEMGRVPDIPFFNKGPLDSPRTTNGAAVQQRRAALRAASQNFEGPPGDPLAPLRDETEPIAKKRTARGVYQIVSHHLTGNNRIPLRTQAPKVRDAPPYAPPLAPPPRTTMQASYLALPAPPRTSAPLSSRPSSVVSQPPALAPHLPSRNAIRNPEVSQWNTGKLITNSNNYDYLPNQPNHASNLPQVGLDFPSENLIPAPVKIDQNISSGGLFHLQNHGGSDAPKTRIKDSEIKISVPVVPASSLFPPISSSSAQKPSGISRPVASSVDSTLNTGPRPKPQVRDGSDISAASTLGPGAPLASVLDVVVNDSSSSVAPQEAFSAKSKSEIARALSPKSPESRYSAIKAENDSLKEVYDCENPSNAINDIEEKDATFGTLHTHINSLNESIDKLKAEVSGIDEFEKSLQARISTMMQLKKDILQRIETKEEAITKIGIDLHEIKRKHDNLKQAMFDLVDKTEDHAPINGSQSMKGKVGKVEDPDIEMSNAAEKASQQGQVIGDWEIKSQRFTYEWPTHERYPGSKGLFEATIEVKPPGETHVEPFVKNPIEHESYSEKRTENFKPQRANEQLGKMSFEATTKAQSGVESEEEASSDESLELNEVLSSPIDRSTGKIENQQWIGESSQDRSGRTIQRSSSSDSFKTNYHKKDNAAGKLAVDRADYEKAEQQRFALLYEETEQKSLTSLCEEAERERLRAEQQRRINHYEKIAIEHDEKMECERQANLAAYKKAEEDRTEMQRLVKEHLERVKLVEKRRVGARVRRTPTTNESEEEKDRTPRDSNKTVSDRYELAYGRDEERSHQELSQRMAENKKVERRFLQRATDPREIMVTKETTALERSDAFNQTTSPKNSVYAGSECGQPRSKKPRFPYHISLDLRPNYGVYPLRVEVRLDQSPEEAITQRCREVMDPIGYQNLISMPKLRLFLDQCNNRHAVRLSKYYASG